MSIVSGGGQAFRNFGHVVVMRGAFGGGGTGFRNREEQGAIFEGGIPRGRGAPGRGAKLQEATTSPVDGAENV